MKLKKLIKVISPHQPIRFSAIIGGCTRHSEVFRIDDNCYQHFLERLGDYKVLSIRSVYDELQLPDYQDIIEIKLQGGNDND